MTQVIERAELLSVQDLAKQRQVCNETIRRHARAGKLPIAKKVGRIMLFDPQRLQPETNGNAATPMSTTLST